jgi:hypothetical protein
MIFKLISIQITKSLLLKKLNEISHQHPAQFAPEYGWTPDNDTLKSINTLANPTNGKDKKLIKTGEVRFFDDLTLQESVSYN